MGGQPSGTTKSITFGPFPVCRLTESAREVSFLRAYVGPSLGSVGMVSFIGKSRGQKF